MASTTSCTSEEKRLSLPASLPPAGETNKTQIYSKIKQCISLIFILFCVFLVSAAIFTRQTSATSSGKVHPILALGVFWLSMFWLAMMEGGLNCIVGLQPIKPKKYEQSHPKSIRCTSVAHKGDNIDRFIVGRQYLDLTIVFITSYMVSVMDDIELLGLPSLVTDIFLRSDLAVIICTIVFGQLIAQINSAFCMLDFVNNWLMVGTTYIALAVESSGILHAVYLIQMFFMKLAGKSIESKEPSRTLLQSIWFWFRVFLSLSISIFAIVVFTTALFTGNTPVRSEIPTPVSILSLLLLLLFGGFMEALQIALFAVKHLPAEAIQENQYASTNCRIMFQERKLQSFLVGRQIAQTVIMFLIARIITIEMKEDATTNLFGVSDVVQSFLESGLLNALVSTIFASLSWRVTANAFPMLFLGSPISIWIIRLCLLVENTGICDGAYIFAKIHQSIVQYKPDSTFLQTTSDDDDDVDSDEESNTRTATSSSSSNATPNTSKENYTANGTIVPDLSEKRENESDIEADCHI